MKLIYLCALSAIVTVIALFFIWEWINNTIKAPVSISNSLDTCSHYREAKGFVEGEQWMIAKPVDTCK